MTDDGDNDKGNGRNAAGQFAQGNTIGWAPGECGNPNGGPRRKTITDWLHEVGAEAYTPDGKLVLDKHGVPRSKLESLARYLYDQALGGNVPAMTAVLDRVDPASRHGLVVAGAILNITIEKGEPPPDFVESHPAAPQLPETHDDT